MLITLLFSFILPLHAEYRAYQLSLVNRTTGTETPIQSTLDHLQYRKFYPVLAEEDVIYVDSWMCWGRTSDFKSICPNPKPPPERSTASTSPASPTPSPTNP